MKDHKIPWFPNRSSMILFILGLSLLMILPIWLDDYWLHFFIMIFFWGFLSQCWNIVGGYCGQLSLGHAAFFGLGAYTSTLLFINFGISPWIGMLCGGFVGAAAGLFIGYLSFRYGLKGAYFALVTIAFAELLRVLALSVKFTNGAEGLMIYSKNPSFFDFLFQDKMPFYFIALLFMIVITVVARKIQRSKTGYYFLSIRENEEAAEALGVDKTRYKLIAITISAFFTACGGSFYAQYVAYVSPDEVFGWSISIEMVLRTLAGGIGTVIGPLAGSFILSIFSEGTRAMMGNLVAGTQMVLYATILILIVLFAPKGLYVLLSEMISRRKKRGGLS